jgi:hypothetical protein
MKIRKGGENYHIFLNIYKVSVLLLLLLYECDMGETCGMHEDLKCLVYKISVGETEDKEIAEEIQM